MQWQEGPTLTSRAIDVVCGAVIGVCTFTQITEGGVWWVGAALAALVILTKEPD